MGLIAQFGGPHRRDVRRSPGGVRPGGRRAHQPPAPSYTRMLIESLPRLTVKGRGRDPGLPPALLALPSGCSFHPRCPFVFERCLTGGTGLPVGRGVARTSCHLYPALRPAPLPSRRRARSDAPTSRRGGRHGGSGRAREPRRDDLADESGARRRGRGLASSVTGLAQSDIDGCTEVAADGALICARVADILRRCSGCATSASFRVASARPPSTTVA
jgi:oligopeptide/dipeptide ABC transporter ATP-binding protein